MQSVVYPLHKMTGVVDQNIDLAIHLRCSGLRDNCRRLAIAVGGIQLKHRRVATSPAFNSLQ